jgi:hypothetical protein
MTIYLVLSAFTSSAISLPATTKAFVFVYSKYASAHYINSVRINQKLMCIIQFEAIIVYLNSTNGT